jgi:single-stranded DNA-binding protein
MRGVNKVILVGTLGKDPETKSFAQWWEPVCIEHGNERAMD